MLICSIYGISVIKLLMFHGTSMKLTFKFYPVISLLFLLVCTDVQIIFYCGIGEIQYNYTD